MSMRSDRARRRASRRRNQRIFIILAAVLVLAAVAFGIYLAVTGDPGSSGDTNGSASGQTTQTASGLIIQVLEEGSGDAAQLGDTVQVHYVGTFEDGTQFDSSYDRGQPAEFELVEGGLIQGWIEGMQGMKEGEKRRLIVPPALGYGSEDYGPIPGNSTLYFDIELLAVNP